MCSRWLWTSVQQVVAAGQPISQQPLHVATERWCEGRVLAHDNHLWLLHRSSAGLLHHSTSTLPKHTNTPTWLLLLSRERKLTLAFASSSGVACRTTPISMMVAASSSHTCD